MKILLNIGYLFAAVVLGFFSAPFFGYLYDNLLQVGLGGGLLGDTSSLEFIVGFPVSFIFFLLVIFSIFGDASKFLWIGFFTLLFLLLALFADLAHIYFHIGVVLVGLALGWGIREVVSRFRAKT